MAEERKLASILFADIVESTAVTSSVDPELARRTLARVFAEMRELLTAHGGTVEKFIGDAVMVVFGVPVAHDDDADRAVRAAFAVRERVRAFTGTLPFPVVLRIGVNTGQVVAGGEGADTLVTGQAVIAAGRLQQNAEPDEILVGALTRSLTAMTVRYARERTIDAKGIGALEAFPAIALESAVPEQRRGLGRLRAPLIGRDAELRLLRETHARVTEERAPYLVTLYGQAGVGKSRLVVELVEVIGRERVLRGRCLPYGTGITYWPLQEILRADTGIAPDESRDNAMRKLRAAVLDALRGSSDDAEAVARRLAVIAGLERAEEALPETQPSDLAQELRWGVRRYFEERATRAGTLTLVIDDIHWAEDPMLAMIEHLGEWTRAPLFLICLARPELRDRRPSWGGGLMNAAAVRVEPLAAEETRRLIAALLDIEALPDAVRGAIVESAQGNPLFVEELLRMLIDTRRIEEREGRWVATGAIDALEVPASLQGLIAARLDQLAPEAKRVLQRAAVIGKVFYADAIEALPGGSGPTDDLLIAAARRDFVFERDERGPGGRRGWQFKHILIRDVAYDSIPKEERSRLHDAVGSWLETVSRERAGEYAEIVAYHADQAYRYAAELLDARADELGRRALPLLLGAATGARRTEDRRTAELYDRVSQVADDVGASPAVRAEARAFATLWRGLVEGHGAVRAAHAEALAQARAAGPSEALVMLIEVELRVVGSAGAKGDDLAREAVHAARSVGDEDLIVFALVTAAWLPWFRGEMDKCAALIAEARAHAVAHDARRHWLWLLQREARVAEQRGDFDTFRSAELERVAAAASTESKITASIVPLGAKTQLARVAGEYEDVLKCGREHLRIASELGTPLLGPHRVIGAALELLGRHREAVEELTIALQLHERRGEPVSYRGEIRQWLARAQLGAGLLDEARSSAERAYAEIEDDDALSRSTTATTLALVRATHGRTEEADGLFRLGIDSAKGYAWQANLARVDYGRFLIAGGRADAARRVLRLAREFYAHPHVARRRAEVDDLLKRCDEVRA